MHQCADVGDTWWHQLECQNWAPLTLLPILTSHENQETDCDAFFDFIDLDGKVLQIRGKSHDIFFLVSLGVRDNHLVQSARVAIEGDIFECRGFDFEVYTRPRPRSLHEGVKLRKIHLRNAQIRA